MVRRLIPALLPGLAACGPVDIVFFYHDIEAREFYDLAGNPADTRNLIDDLRYKAAASPAGECCPCGA